MKKNTSKIKIYKMKKLYTPIVTALAMFFISSCGFNADFSITETININASKENIKAVYKNTQGIINVLDRENILEEILDEYPDANIENIQKTRIQTSMIEESFSSTLNNKKTNVENCFVNIKIEMKYNKSKPEEAHELIKEYKTILMQELIVKGIRL